MAQDYNFKPSFDVVGAASLMQKKALAEQEQKNLEIERKYRIIQEVIKTGQTLAADAVARSKRRQQEDFADALAKTKMTPGEVVPEQTIPGAEQTPTMERPDVTKMVGGNNGFMDVAQGTEQPDGTVVPQLEKAPDTVMPSFQLPPTDNPTSTAIRKGAVVNPEEASKQFMEQQFPGPQGAMGMYGSGIPVRNRDTGERAFAQFGKDGSIFVGGRKLNPEEIGQWDREYAPQAIETTGGILMAPKIPGASYDTAGAAPDKKEGKTTRESYTVPELEHLNKTKLALEGDTVYNKLIGRDNELQQAVASIDTGNWVGDATIPSLLAKGLGRDAGALSDQDQKRYNVSPEVWRRIKTKYNKWVEGELTAEDRDDIREAVRVAGEKNQELIDARAKIYFNKAKAGVKNGNDDYLWKFLVGEDKPAGGGGLQIDTNALDAELKKRGL